ncbi:class I SAM-dependent methyltransferase [Roseomonas sp. GC11]|uniref:class I SAM-dependent methyltransferase n=1 Tax=Roseomonas sp. GC11 TaxID=2950546 RepID=UPI00210F028E|nr:class I SAM-dependent methyltransferase [Roseomonas sp. GC11]MCQ4161690.1 class I SAM-dependent methyltransferase [Roseomonas sp. GC11]
MPAPTPQRRGRAAAACPVCGARGLLPLPAPGLRGMVSDGRMIGLPTARWHCRRCGCAGLSPRVARRLPRRLFGAGYELNRQAPTPYEVARQEGLARRIAALWPDAAAPASVLDIGCGNGTLLRALGALWPAARLAGVEPAPQAAAAARRGGLAVQATARPGQRAALVVSVNVIEHTADPLGFLRLLRRCVAPGGHALLLCPDGSLPWVELLVLDHRFSFLPRALGWLAGRAGWRVCRAEPQPGGTQALLLRAGPVRRAALPPGAHGATARRRYMARWARLGHALLARAPEGRLLGFGLGETAQLLRAYAGPLWRRLDGLTADPAACSGQGGIILGKPLVAVEEAGALLMLVAPAAQAGLAPRLLARSAAPVLRWDDLVAR